MIAEPEAGFTRTAILVCYFEMMHVTSMPLRCYSEYLADISQDPWLP
jgi:hypothetical protein